MNCYQASLCFLLCFCQCIGTSDARPAEPDAQSPGSLAIDLPHSVSHVRKGQSRDKVLALQNTSREALFKTEKFFVNPNLTIQITLTTSVQNTTALSLVLSNAKAYAQTNLDHYGASTVIPGRIRRDESGVEYDVKPPRRQARSSFTWGYYEAVTDWLYNYLVVVGHEAHCVFILNVVLENHREVLIGFGQVHGASTSYEAG